MPERGDEEWGGEDRPSGARNEGLLAASLSASARALEREQDRWFLWLPVLFAGGIITYFALADEPDARVAVALLVGAIGLALAARHAPLGLCFGGAALAFASGFAAAKLRTELVRAPVLAHELRYTKLTGFVETHELRDKGRARITLRVLTLDDLKPENRPYRVRVTLPAKDVSTLEIGNAVALLATLQPPPEPIEPGGFDFGRQAWFARLGGTGYATSKVEPIEGALPPPWDLSAWGLVDVLRAKVNARIRAALPGETGEIAAALITGERGGISEEVTQSMRDSGLAHILSISGLHMVIMAGTVFWLVRALLALVPALALRYPIKKWAAAAALAAATFYLALSGAAVPTVRSWIIVFPPATAASYSVDNWLLADGDDRDAAAASSDEAPFAAIASAASVRSKARSLRSSARRGRGGLPHCRYRHRALHHRSEMPRGAGDRRSTRAEGGRRACALYRGPLDQDRDGRSLARASTLGPQPGHCEGDTARSAGTLRRRRRGRRSRQEPLRQSRRVTEGPPNSGGSGRPDVPARAPGRGRRCASRKRDWRLRARWSRLCGASA